MNVLMSASWPLLEHLEVQALNAIAALLSAGDGTEFDSMINEVVKPSEVANGCWPNLKLLVLGGPSGACIRPF